MNVLHISTNDSSGAGLCAYRIHKSLQAANVNSKMVVLNKKQKDGSVVAILKKRYFIYRCFHAVLRKLGIYLFEYDKLVKLSNQYGAPFTRPITPFDISDHPLVKEADIIHLHWIDDFFNQEKFFRKVRKPIIWTLHDEGIFYGISHYHDSLLIDNPIEKKYRLIKADMIRLSSNLSFVILSKHFQRLFNISDILSEHRYVIINNLVDVSKFILFDKARAREELNLDNNAIFFAFLANNINDHHKGLNILISAIEIIQDCNCKILAIGHNGGFKGSKYVKETGPIDDIVMISKYLSASDFYVLPSLQEAFSQSLIEAMACGLPAVAFPVSGTEDVFNSTNGIVCKDFTTDSLVEGLKMVMRTEYHSSDIRDAIINRFSSQVIANKYIDLYTKVQV